MLTSICYITSRKNPLWDWFIDSLDSQTTQEEKDTDIELIFVDRLVDGDNEAIAERKQQLHDAVRKRFRFEHVPPKASVWQGSHRVTSQDWFAASNARNTGVVRALGEFIVFADDLSVLAGTWWAAIKDARADNKVTCGAYQKMRSMKVENGNILFSEAYPGGVDNRLRHSQGSDPVPCKGNWLYGCSFACPTEFLLAVNGSDEACDGMGFEDCILGIRVANQGYEFQYDRRMMTYESDEHHHLDAVMRRTDKGTSPNDKSHAMLKLAEATTYAENSHFGPDGIRGLKKVFMDTGEIPLPSGPTHDWYDGQSIAEMT
jgi:glycosyltransferase involved in cell wall biosynthesis